MFVHHRGVVLGDQRVLQAADEPRLGGGDRGGAGEPDPAEPVRGVGQAPGAGRRPGRRTRPVPRAAGWSGPYRPTASRPGRLFRAERTGRGVLGPAVQPADGRRYRGSQGEPVSTSSGPRVGAIGHDHGEAAGVAVGARAHVAIGHTQLSRRLDPRLRRLIQPEDGATTGPCPVSSLSGMPCIVAGATDIGGFNAVTCSIASGVRPSFPSSSPSSAGTSAAVAADRPVPDDQHVTVDAGHQLPPCTPVIKPARSSGARNDGGGGGPQL